MKNNAIGELFVLLTYLKVPFQHGLSYEAGPFF